MEDCAPSTFLGNLTLVALYLCSKICIFDRPILEKYVSQVERGPHLLYSCLCATRNGLPHVTKEMHLFFESLTITDTPSLQTSLMEFHHNMSLRSNLEDDSISSTSKAHICYYLGKGARLLLVTKPSIHSFHIANSTFTLVLCFRFDFIQPLTSSLLTCECGHGLDTYGTHIICCLFGGPWITTHDTI